MARGVMPEWRKVRSALATGGCARGAGQMANKGGGGGGADADDDDDDVDSKEEDEPEACVAANKVEAVTCGLRTEEGDTLSLMAASAASR